MIKNGLIYLVNERNIPKFYTSLLKAMTIGTIYNTRDSSTRIIPYNVIIDTDQGVIKKVNDANIRVWCENMDECVSSVTPVVVGAQFSTERKITSPFSLSCALTNPALSPFCSQFALTY